MPKHKILFVLPSLHPGGAERVMSVIAQNLNNKKFDVQLLVIYNSGSRDYKVEEIPITYLKKERTLLAIPQIIKHINALKPAIVITSIGQLNILGGLLNCFYKKTSFVAREASVYSVRKKFSNNRSFFHDYLTKFSYKRLTALICESTDTAEDLYENLGIEKDKLIRIGNPIHFKLQNNFSEKPENAIPQLISVGRLVKVKGFERIIKALSLLSFNFHYTLIGDGKDKELLLKKIKDSGLENQFTYISYTNKVQDYLFKSDLFLQGSYVEGFGMVLLESLAVGTPAVVFDAPGGPRDLIKQGINGFKAKDQKDFNEKIYQALFEQKWNKESIMKSVSKTYSKKTIIKKYEQFFCSVIAK